MKHSHSLPGGALLICGLATMAMATLGCGSKTTLTPGGTVTENKRGTITVRQPGNTAEVSQGAASVQLPDDFPEDVSIYPDSKVVMVNTNPAAVIVAVETSDSIQQVFEHYEKEMADHQWDQTQALKTEKGGTISFQKEKRVCTVTVATKSNSGESVATVMLQSRP